MKQQNRMRKVIVGQGFELSIACLVNILHIKRPQDLILSCQLMINLILFDMFSTFALKEEGG